MKHKFVIISSGGQTFLLIAPEGEAQTAQQLADYYFTKVCPTDGTVEQFVNWLVNGMGFARQDEGCDFEHVQLGNYSLD
jgi:hypothetical protein